MVSQKQFQRLIMSWNVYTLRHIFPLIFYLFDFSFSFRHTLMVTVILVFSASTSSLSRVRTGWSWWAPEQVRFSWSTRVLFWNIVAASFLVYLLLPALLCYCVALIVTIEIDHPHIYSLLPSPFAEGFGEISSLSLSLSTAMSSASCGSRKLDAL